MRGVRALLDRSYDPRAALLACVIVLLVFPIKLRLDVLAENPRRESPSELAFMTYLEMRAPDEQCFLAPVNMHIYWRLNESQHGFPHAANTRFITELDWWDAIVMSPDMVLLTNTNEYCQKLEGDDPNLMVFFEESPLISCLNNSMIYQGTDLIEGAWLFERR